MLAEAIFTGTEMLLGQIVNTNAACLSRELAAAGISLYRQVVVGDNLERIREAIDDARRRADLIIVSGGLGPTEDDLSREALAAALNLPLVEDPAARENVTRYFAARRRPMTSNNLKQALLPAGARALDNPFGTAAGVFLEHEGKIYALLPGPPREFEPMVVDRLLPLLEPYGARREVIFSRVLKIAGMGESAVEEALKDLLHGDNPTLAPLAAPGEVTLRLTARAGSPEQARELIRPLEAAIRERLGEHIFGSDADTLEGVVGAILAGRRLTLAIAESCTGGLLAHRVTNIPGSSDYFLGGMVAYSNEAKIKFLGVEEETLAAHGAVSPEVAAAMAQGVRRAFAAGIGVGITGIAGPGGGTPAKPVGLVYVGLDIQGKVEVRRELFIGDRESIKWQSSQSALYLLWRGLRNNPCH
ncbi:Putative competence-damage inducible protein [Neomoorella glycerini]|uniref:Putative competence-damage inducible protein n=1 Tax=Neomoorella glycerini TaxID=55779 RepID=A0A6I5ZS05_9FIRM|nr:competence/damage-inducible protein A [Moorella glycerini]QGP92793.1 Putative competence-damage inducible protein [Moorella glycerini]